MQSRREINESRRAMLRSAARSFVLGGLAVLSAGLLARGKGASAESRCPRPGICRRCAVLASCSLPPALAARKKSKR
ncbi:MAG: hypothetical protein ABIK89_16745 [Planctomycetota bacterium]